MGSVIKKRRKRMSKKKHRKLLRKTRHQRRNKKYLRLLRPASTRFNRRMRGVLHLAHQCVNLDVAL